MTLKVLLKGVFTWLIKNGKVPELFCGEVTFSFHNGIPNRKYKVTHHENINE